MNADDSAPLGALGRRALGRRSSPEAPVRPALPRLAVVTLAGKKGCCGGFGSGWWLAKNAFVFRIRSEEYDIPLELFYRLSKTANHAK